MKSYVRWPLCLALMSGYWILIEAARLIPPTPGFFSDAGDLLAAAAGILLMTFGYINWKGEGP